MNIIDSLDVSDVSKNEYINKYKKCLSLGISYNDTEGSIIDKIDSLYNEKINNKMNYLNIIIVLKFHSGQEIDKLKKYRNELRDIRLNTKNPTHDKEIYTSTTPDTLYSYSLSLYINKNYKAYIINFLLINFNVRNKDLDLIITTKKPNDTEANYLYLNFDECIYIRNHYKTVKKYGQKTHIIKNKSFIDSVVNILGSNESKRLLTAPNYSSVADEIIRNTYMRLGEASYFKILARDANMNLINKMSKNRGTDLTTIYNFYNLSKN